MDESIALKTQEALSTLVKKTPLTTKLLSKPPFRFLHDVISEVIKTSGFGSTLYSGVETDSAAIKDKDAKIAYLNKIIDHVGATLSVEIKARPQKIVAGLEPEETNSFLQLLGKAAKKKPADNQTPPSSAKKSASAQEKTSSSDALSGKRSASKSRLTDDKSKRDATKVASKSRESVDSARKVAPNPSSSVTTAEVSSRKGSAETVPVPRPEPESTIPADSEPRKERKSEKAPSSEPDLEISDRRVGEAQDSQEVRRVDDEVAKKEAEEEKSKNRRRNEEAVEEKPDIAESIPAPEYVHHLLRPMSVRRPMRPASARPAPPRQKLVEAVPEIPSQVVNIIEDKSKPDADDDEDYIVVAPTTPAAMTTLPSPAAGVEASQEQHGGLVRKMLETKKELESDTAAPVSSNGTTGPEEDANGSNLFTARERMTARKEIEALRESIQTLCRCTNPLGTTMDYVQEDVDSMNKELEYWVKEYKQYSSKHDEALRLTKQSLAPMEEQLGQLEISIEEKYDLISGCKAKILENESTIQKLLSSIAQPIR